MVYTAGDAKSAKDTFARATCVTCGFSGPENEICTFEVNPLSRSALMSARVACPNQVHVDYHGAVRCRQHA